MLPNFLIVGSGKCGSTALWVAFSQHPEIFALEGEPNFFNLPENFARGTEWYASHFASAKGAKAVGERCTRLVLRELYPDTAARMAEVVPDAKIICTVRHPVRYLESRWVQMREGNKKGVLTGRPIPWSFTDAVKDGLLISSAKFWWQLEPYRDHFPADRILVIFAEDYRSDPQATLRRCWEFLGVDPEFRVAKKEAIQNRSEGKKLYTESLDRLRSIPGFRLLKRLAPRKLVESTRDRLFRKKWSGRPVWDRETHRWFLEQLSDDPQQLLAHHGKPADFWNLHDCEFSD